MVEDNQENQDTEQEQKTPELTPTRILLRGVAVSLPTILTIVVLIWLVNFVNKYFITPATWTVKYSMSHLVDESIASSQLTRIDAPPPLDYCDTGYLVKKELSTRYRKFSNGLQSRIQGPPDVNGAIEGAPVSPAVLQQRRIDWMQAEAEKLKSEVFVQLGPTSVPYPIYAEVARYLPPNQMPTSARAVYMEYVAHRYFGSLFHLTALTVLLIVVVLYFVGKFVSAKLGGLIVRLVEVQILGRLPVVRNIYGSVKQVTDFLLTENQPVEYRRVAAVQYTRKGVWAIGFVTGESMMQISIGAGEPCVSVFIPTSPMPMTGFTVNVPRSEVLDLDITVEQAMQFCISCGVLSPSHQKMTPQKFKELVEQGLIRASLASPQYLPGQNVIPVQPVPGGQPIVPPKQFSHDDDGEED